MGALRMNYGELQNAVEEYLDHRDSNDQIQLFIELARAKINRELMVREMVCVATARGEDGKTDFELPGDWAGAREVSVGGQTVLYAEPERFTDMIGSNYPSTPRYYTIRAGKIRFTGAPPVPDADAADNIELVYYRKVPELVEDTDTTWLLESHPDAWLYLAIAEGHAFVMDEPRADFWAQRGMGILQHIESHDWRERWSAGTLRIRGT